MSCIVWFISRHSLWKVQFQGIKNTYGEAVTVKNKHIRFKTVEEFTTFVRRANRISVKPYFIATLPEEFFAEAIKLKLSFGTVAKPTLVKDVRIYVIRWFAEGISSEIFRKALRKPSNKGYYNSPQTH